MWNVALSDFAPSPKAAKPRRSLAPRCTPRLCNSIAKLVHRRRDHQDPDPRNFKRPEQPSFPHPHPLPHPLVCQNVEHQVRRNRIASANTRGERSTLAATATPRAKPVAPPSAPYRTVSTPPKRLRRDPDWLVDQVRQQAPEREPPPGSPSRRRRGMRWVPGCRRGRAETPQVSNGLARTEGAAI